MSVEKTDLANIESFEELERVIREAVRDGARLIEIDIENSRVVVYRTRKFQIPEELVQ